MTQRWIAYGIAALAVLAGCSSSDNSNASTTTVPTATTMVEVGPDAVQRCTDKLAGEIADLIDSRDSRAMADAYGVQSYVYQSLFASNVISDVSMERTNHGIDAALDLLVRRAAQACGDGQIRNEVLDLHPGDGDYSTGLPAIIPTTPTPTTVRRAAQPATTTTRVAPSTTTMPNTQPPDTASAPGVVDDTADCSSLPSGCNSNAVRCPWGGTDVIQPGTGIDAPCPSVEQLQQYLNAWGYAVDIDGRFGSGTETAVKQFQSDNGLQPDGLVGPATWKLLSEADSWDY
jgi:hypothetical protein